MQLHRVLLPLCFLISIGLPAQNWKVVSQENVFEHPPFKQCHASTIAEDRDGNLLIACFGGEYEGSSDVGVWMKVQDGGNWSDPIKAVSGYVNGKEYPCWNPVLFQLPGGKMMLYYKVGPNPREWWGMQRLLEKGGQAANLPAGILGPIKNKPIILDDGTIVSPSSTESASGAWHVHVEISKDDGKTWRRVDVDTTSPFKVIQPTILQYGNRLQMLCRSNQQKIVESWSEDGGQTWSPLVLTNVPNPNSGIDAVTLDDGTQMLVYNPTIGGQQWWDGRSMLAVATSTDGKTWNRIMMLENQMKGEFSYPAIIQTADGKVHITYTLDRKNIRHVVLEQQETN